MLCADVLSRYLAILGALISIMSLAFGTFTQQMISFEPFPIKNLTTPSSPGNILRSETYDSF
jgi:hypothetical protein